MAADAGGRTVWNDKTRSDLLQAIVDVAPPSTKEWEAIISRLRAKGYTYNYSAALQHLQKLKKKEGPKAANGAAGSPGGGGKPTSGSRIIKTSTGDKKKRKLVHDFDKRLDDDDEKVEFKRIKAEADSVIFGQYAKHESDHDNDGEI